MKKLTCENDKRIKIKIEKFDNVLSVDVYNGKKIKSQFYLSGKSLAKMLKELTV